MKKLIVFIGILALVACKNSVSEIIKKAEQGDAVAQVEYARMLRTTGNGVDMDWDKAVEMFQKSAEKGNPETQYKIGNCYETGEGTAKDFEKAMLWYKKSASQGYSDAIKALERLK